MSVGFGLERLGILTLKFPRLIGAAVLAISAMFVFVVPNASMDGNILRVYANSGKFYDRYIELRDTFGTFESDVYLLVKSDNLRDPDVIEHLRQLSFELQLNSFAVGTLSPFSLRKPAADNVSIPAVTENMSGPDQVQQVLTDLRSEDPIMQNLILEDLSGMVMIMFPDPDKIPTVEDEDRMVAEVRDLVEWYTNDEVTIELTGPPIWKGEMLDATAEDQIKFSLVGFAIGFVTAFILFRSFWGAVLATLTPALSVLWVMGSVTLIFGQFTFLTNVVTTLVLVIAFAESMFFCFTWLRLWREGMDPTEAVTQTVLRVSPACALTSITTMIALGSLALTQGQGIQEFALSGVLAVSVAFITLVTALPLALKAAVRFGYKRPDSVSGALTAPIPPARYLATRFTRPLAIGSIIAMALMFYPHFAMEPHFGFKDFLPNTSDSLATAEGIDAGVGGVAPIYVRIPLKAPVNNVSDSDFETIVKVHEILENNVGAGKVISAASFQHYADSGFTRDQIFNAVGPFLKHRFVTEAGDQALITGFVPTVLDSDLVRDVVIQTEADLFAAGIPEAEVAGFGVLTAFASTDIIRSLQQGLTLAIVVNIIIIGIAFRSWQIALVSVVPNFIPILGTELFLWLSGSGLQLTTVIALTVAFGIAVDDTIHFLASYKRNRENGYDHEAAVKRALELVGPAMVATTLILCAGTAIVLSSTLPQVALFGTLTVLTLALALVGDLVVLPAMLLAGGRLFGSMGEKKK